MTALLLLFIEEHLKCITPSGYNEGSWWQFSRVSAVISTPSVPQSMTVHAG